MVDNKKAYQIVASVDFSIMSTFVEKDENYYFVILITNFKDVDRVNRYNQILSTFKFTEK